MVRGQQIRAASTPLSHPPFSSGWSPTCWPSTVVLKRSGFHKSVTRAVADETSKDSLGKRPAEATLSQLGLNDQSVSEFVSECDSISRLTSILITIPGDIAGEFSDTIIAEGAVSCSVEDANVGTDDEQEMFHAGSLAGERAFVYRDPVEDEWLSSRGMWDQSRLIALFPQDVDIAEVVATASRILGIETPKYEMKGVVDEDWVQKVKDAFIAVEVAKGVWVVPTWLEPVDPAAINILLEPGLAFGTGEHPTTRLCMQWMRSNIKAGETVMDYGTGSGILAIGALKLGAKSADGTDIDALAVESSMTNASLNGVADKFFCSECDKDGGIENEKVGLRMDNAYYDVMIANILLPPLLALEERLALAVRPNGKICLSGVLNEQAPRVVEVYKKHFDDLSVDSDNEGMWACIHGTRRS